MGTSLRRQNMRLIIREEKLDVSVWAARYVKHRINTFNGGEGPTAEKPFVLGLPTGSTPLGMYKELVKMHKAKPKEGQKKLSSKHVITFNMDEYVFPHDLTPCAKNPNSYHYYMWENFFQHIDIQPQNVNILDGDTTPDKLAEECQKFEEKIRNTAPDGNGKIELFIGGIGPDGHVAFNEPGSSLVSRTRVKTLAEETVLANQQHFKAVAWDANATDELSKNVEGTKRMRKNGKGEALTLKGSFVPDAKKQGALQKDMVPQMALTVGVGTVMDANEVMILVTGQPKANALAKCIEEGVSHQWTVSMIQLHRRSCIVCDKAATAEMRVRTVDYYRGLEKVHNQLLGEDNPDKLMLGAPRTGRELGTSTSYENLAVPAAQDAAVEKAERATSVEEIKISRASGDVTVTRQVASEESAISSLPVLAAGLVCVLFGIAVGT